MRALRTEREFPAPPPSKNNPSSGLWPVGAHDHVEPGDTLPVNALASTIPNTDGMQTVRAPLPTATTRPVGPGPISGRGVYDVEIPQAPRMPFSLRPRAARGNRWRAEVLVEWVKLNADDPRCQ